MCTTISVGCQSAIQQKIAPFTTPDYIGPAGDLALEINAELRDKVFDVLLTFKEWDLFISYYK